MTLTFHDLLSALPRIKRARVLRAASSILAGFGLQHNREQTREGQGHQNPKQNDSKRVLRFVPDDTVRPAQRLRLPVIHWETVDDAFAYSNMSFLSWLNPSRQKRRKKLSSVYDSQRAISFEADINVRRHWVVWTRRAMKPLPNKEKNIVRTLDRGLAWLLVLGGMGHAIGSWTGYRKSPETLLWA